MKHDKQYCLQVIDSMRELVEHGHMTPRLMDVYCGVIKKRLPKPEWPGSIYFVSFKA